MLSWVVDDEGEIMRKEAVVAISRYYYEICRGGGGLRTTDDRDPGAATGSRIQVCIVTGTSSCSVRDALLGSCEGDIAKKETALQAVSNVSVPCSDKYGISNFKTK
jgi:hypothetical protein